jgi:hypothetical protein
MDEWCEKNNRDLLDAKLAAENRQIWAQEQIASLKAELSSTSGRLVELRRESATSRKVKENNWMRRTRAPMRHWPCLQSAGKS